MKKAVIYLSLILLVGVLSCQRVEKKQTIITSSEDDSVAFVDTQQEAADEAAKAEAEQAAAEQAKQDSIRQDSIAKEEKMKLGQLSFISHKGDWKKILPKFGFKLTSRKTHIEPSDYDEEDTCEITDYVYTRDLNDRKVTFKFDTYDGYGDYCATMIIHDPNERKRFIQDVKKLNKMKGDEEYGEIWQASNIDHYLRYLKGEFIFDTDH